MKKIIILLGSLTFFACDVMGSNSNTGYFSSLWSRLFRKTNAEKLKQDFDSMRATLLSYIEQVHPNKQEQNYLKQRGELTRQETDLKARLSPLIGKVSEKEKAELEPQLKKIKENIDENYLFRTMVEMRDRLFASIVSSVATHFTDEWYKKYQVESMENMPKFQDFFNGVVRDLKRVLGDEKTIQNIKEELRGKTTTNYIGDELKGVRGKSIAIEHVWNARVKNLNEYPSSLRNTREKVEAQRMDRGKSFSGNLSNLTTEKSLPQAVETKSNFSQRRNEEEPSEPSLQNIDIQEEGGGENESEVQKVQANTPVSEVRSYEKATVSSERKKNAKTVEGKSK